MHASRGFLVTVWLFCFQNFAKFDWQNQGSSWPITLLLYGTPSSEWACCITNTITTILIILQSVHIIRVKVVLRWRLKLIVMISLSINMMTSQDCICVQCVANGLQRTEIWKFTNKHILETSCIHVLSVRNVLLIIITWGCIWMFTAVNTSALNVESVFNTIKH